MSGAYLISLFTHGVWTEDNQILDPGNFRLATFRFRQHCTGLNILDPLDPDAVVCDVEVIEDIGRIVLPEDLMDGQQTLQDAGLACDKETSSKSGLKHKDVFIKTKLNEHSHKNIYM